MAKNARKSGDEGEEIAVKFLIEKGYEIIERNYHFGHGEIDIIAGNDDTLVFVEVKTRESLEYGLPEYSITKGKQSQIRKIASAYLYEKDIKEKICRLDVIAIVLQKGKEPYINHIENAF